MAKKQVLYPIGSKITFITNGRNEMFKLLAKSTYDMIEEAILEKFESYREESLCINGINVMFPNIKSGYLIIEGKMADMLAKTGKHNYYTLKDIHNIMQLGLRKGDRLDLKGVSSFKVTNVDFGNRVLCVELE